jgi:hypothetical protein
LNFSKAGCVTTLSVYNQYHVDLPVFVVVVIAHGVLNVANAMDLQWFPSNLHIYLHQSIDVFHPLETLCHVPT